MAKSKTMPTRIARKVVHVIIRDFTNQIMDAVVKALTKKNVSDDEDLLKSK